MSGTGGYDDFQSGQYRRHQISEGFPNPGACLDHQLIPVQHGLLDGHCHLELLRPEREIFDTVGKPAMFGQILLDSQSVRPGLTQ